MLTNKDIVDGITFADKAIVLNPKQYEKMVFEELYELSLQEDNFINKEKNRIGGSEIGNACERMLYYSYHKFPCKQNSARLTRLFNRGKLEEARIFAYLKLMGLKPVATDEEHKQFYFEDFNGSFSGHCDGIITHNDDKILLEMKTMNEKSYTDTSKVGVYMSKIQYYSQMQVYMGYMGLKQALFVSVNKNTDEIYFQLIPFDEIMFKGLQAKVKRIIECEDINLLYRESTLPSYYKCKWCNYYNVCFNKGA